MIRHTVSLLHYPVLDKEGNLYTTSITNMDVHDIARSSFTYGFYQYYVVSPIEAQRQMAEKIASFWQEEKSQNKNIDRSQALSIVRVKESLQETIDEEEKILLKKPLIISTSAKKYPNKNISYENLRELMKKRSTMLILGTGHGLHESVLEMSDFVLEPIYGPKEYNHLSVRSAAAIIFDRLMVIPKVLL